MRQNLMHNEPRPRPQLSAAETEFLRVWIWEEANFQRPHATTAKRIQVEKSPYAAPQLADIIAAAMTAEEQVAIAGGAAPTNTPPFPWSTDKEIQARHREARVWLESRFGGGDPVAGRHASVLPRGGDV